MTHIRHFGLGSRPTRNAMPADPHGADTRADNIITFSLSGRSTANSPPAPTGGGLGPSPSFFLGSGPPVPFCARYPIAQTFLDVLAVIAIISIITVMTACIVWLPLMFIFGVL